MNTGSWTEVRGIRGFVEEDEDDVPEGIQTDEWNIHLVLDALSEFFTLPNDLEVPENTDFRLELPLASLKNELITNSDTTTSAISIVLTAKTNVLEVTSFKPLAPTRSDLQRTLGTGLSLGESSPKLAMSAVKVSIKSITMLKETLTYLIEFLKTIDGLDTIYAKALTESEPLWISSVAKEREVAEAQKVYNARNDELLQIRQELQQLVNKVMYKMETAIQISLEGSKLG